MILSDGQWRTFHHPEFPAAGASGIGVEQIQGLPGKAETVSNVIISELDNSVKRTQAIILCPTREAAQKMYMLISAAAAAAALAITTHLSVGGTNVREDVQRLKERPHVVIGTIGRLYAMLERKTIIAGDINFLCVEGIQRLLGSNYENEVTEFCEQLPKDLVVVFLSTQMRYKDRHDFDKLFTRKPLHFLVEEDPAPEPSPIPHDLVSTDIEKNQVQGTTRITVRLVCTSTNRIFVTRARAGHRLPPSSFVSL
jgi:superfamily II DNA/RNA helicase